MHLDAVEGYKDHPLLVIIESFREKLRAYIEERSQKINASAKYYEVETQQEYIASQNKRLLEYCVSEIREFVKIIHDALVRFYQLDVKMTMDATENESLFNLITSLVLKSPVYTEIHMLIQLHHKNAFKKISNTIVELRKKYPNLAETIKIEEAKMGRQILLIKAKKAFNQEQEEYLKSMSHSVVGDKEEEDMDF